LNFCTAETNTAGRAGLVFWLLPILFCRTLSEMKPIFKEIEGFPLYRIGTDGTLLSYRHDRKGKGRWKKLKPTAHTNGGYLRAYLGNGIKEAGRYVFIHILVLEAFVGKCPEGMEACHYDDNPRNNRLENLRWGTRLDNTQDRIRRGRVPKGQDHARTRFTNEDIISIRRRHKEGVTVTQLAKEHGVTTGCITSIHLRWTWKHI